MWAQLAAVAHVALFALVVPVAALLSARMLARGPLPARPSLYRGVILQQGIFFLLSLGVAHLAKISLVERPQAPLAASLVSALLTLILVGALHPLWRREVAHRPRRASLAMPSDVRERRLWVGVSIAAGLGEEIAYRGVLTPILSGVTGSPIVGALLSALVFGAGHAVQGVGGVAVTMVVGLVLQGVVTWSGSLLPAIAIHVAYDVIAGFTYARLGRELGVHSTLASSTGERTPSL